MRKKFVFYLLGILLVFGLTACNGESSKQSEADTESNSEEGNSEETVAGNGDDTEDSDTEAATTEEREIVDCVPEGPEDINFGPDNIGFYMEGETFTLPMPYSEFLAKAEGLGWSVDEEHIYLSSTGEYGYGKITFERFVENQEQPETFDIMVINSVDPAKDVDLTDPDIHVVTFYMYMFGSSHLEEIDGDYVSVYNAYNINSQLYLTKEIGMGRSIFNAPPVWGEATSGSGFVDFVYTTGDGDATWYQSGLSSDRYIWLQTSKNSSNASDTYHLVEEKYGGDCKHIITSIKLNNNPYIQ